MKACVSFNSALISLIDIERVVSLFVIQLLQFLVFLFLLKERILEKKLTQIMIVGLNSVIYCIIVCFRVLSDLVEFWKWNGFLFSVLFRFENQVNNIFFL